ncbi:MAG: asparagine synthase (glutamine-hydrolyzing) [Methanosarcinaceae archaeon]|nr:asparagine synthase (glutamine-hydrolyzing) [Methanosarcinaceae archaeon]
MCGITGIFHFDGKNIDLSVINAMNDSLSRRGPDDEGYVGLKTEECTHKQFFGKDTAAEIKERFEDISSTQPAGLGFNLTIAHRRLSIIDLSPSGHQPMHNDDFKIWMVYNGEIYNYVELKEELSKLGYVFKTNTDSEVVIHAYEEWGYKCLNKFNGMWAFAIWDQNKKELFCSRDRFGIKPFYYSLENDRFIFASEIKALLKSNVNVSPNEDAIGNYLAFGMKDYSDNTFFNGISQLMPGHYMVVGKGGARIKKYYSLSSEHNIELKGLAFPEKPVNELPKDSVENLLLDSIKLRLRSDVSLGSNLSGGIDSSIIVGCISSIFKPENYTTYSFFTKDPNTDESKFVKIVSEEKNVVNKYTYLEDVDEEAIRSTIRKIDEPFRSFGILSIDQVFELAARDGTKVILDGQGADEIFYGYGYHYVFYLREHLRHLKITSFFKDLQSILHYNRGIKKNLVKFILSIFIPYPVKAKIKRHTLRKEGITVYPHRFENQMFKNIKNMDELTGYSLIESPLPEYLNFEDKISMYHSVESRVPFLDYRLVEYVSKLPYTYKIHRGVRKYILREAFKEILPPQVYGRMDKKGMTNDEELLFKTSLTDFANRIFASQEFKSRKFWDAETIKKDYGLFLKGEKNYNPIFWRTIAVELWLRMYW